MPVGALTGPIRALFSDIDGTLTTSGRVEAATFATLERLGEAGIAVVLVTGRPAGWGHAFMAMVPFAAVVTENGGVTFVREGRRLKKVYGVPPASLPEWRRRMLETVHDIQREVPGARLSLDSKYREVDLAIDWNEEVSLSAAEAEIAVAMCRKKGFAATRSSVHVNFGPPHFDKMTACTQVIRTVLGGDGEDLSSYVFVGDALNDAPMFQGFPKSVGVANVKNWWNELEAKPRYLCEHAEGAGLRELADHLMRIR